MRVFFTGCTHFDHARIIQLAARPFASVDEMNEALVDNWNAVVGPNDFVYHLGDVGFDDKRLGHWLGRLNGLKYIVLGNHDDARAIQKLCTDKQGDVVGCGSHEMMPAKDKRGGFMPRGAHLYHYPVDDWHRRWRGSLHLHAHTHSPILRWHHPPLVGDEHGNFNLLGDNYPEEVKCNRFCVGVDSTRFAPISLEEIVEESLRDED
jgi:calcineurin-like phosphoesterase family protein